MESQTFTTSAGDVSLSRLLHVYEVYVACEKRRAAKRTEFNQTEEGRELNRSRYKVYYEKNKEKVREKNKSRYHTKKEETTETVTLE